MAAGLMAQQAAPGMTVAPETVKPNYALAARFMPQPVGEMIFDTSVTPHWFAHSDKFWYSYRTTAGTDYYLVDPARKTRTPLWDNAKLAEQLSMLTNLPYDAQHLGIEQLELIDNDTAMSFLLAVRQDAKLPGEPTPPPIANRRAQGQQGGANGATGVGGAGGNGGEPATRDVYFRYDIATAQVRRLDAFTPEVRPMWAQVSPDGQTVIFARGENLYEMDAANFAKAEKDPADAAIQETQLTTDGVTRYSYASSLTPEVEDALKKEDKKDADNKLGMRRPAIGIHWSQDGKKFALVRRDERKVAELWVIHSLATPRPELETYSYAMPGDSNVPISELQIFTLADRQRVVVPEKNFPLAEPMISIADAPATSVERERAAAMRSLRTHLHLEGGGGASGRWLASGSDLLYFTATARDFRDIDLGVINTSTGSVKTLIQESSNVWLDIGPNDANNASTLRLLDHGQQILWWSERDGWAHYYLYDASGKLLHPITHGTYMAGALEGVDETAGAMYFLASGHDPKMDPYYQHLLKVGLDGSAPVDLTPGNFDHAVQASDDAHYFVSNASRVDSPTVSSVEDGAGVAALKLETADVSRLLAAGYQYPTTFHVKAADGITDLYGVMYKPFDFDPHKKYPIIEYVYPGPQTESVTKGFTPKSASVPLAQLGFIVIEVGNRGGSPQRDKWYDSFGYGNLRDYGLADKKAAVEELAAEYPYIDAARVGIWGHSGGGFMTAAALLQYPTFFTAGWSESGNHDNNVYNKTWSEKYDGVRREAAKDGTLQFVYDIEKNSDLAKNLQGHLMLTTGDMDNNVSMVNTMHLANALIHADKRFEMLVFPGMRHPYTPINDYVLVRRMDFFAHWLLGASETGANILELQNQKQATPSKKFIE